MKQDYAKNTIASCVNVAVSRAWLFLGQVCGIRAELPSSISEYQLTSLKKGKTPHPPHRRPYLLRK